MNAHPMWKIAVVALVAVVPGFATGAPSDPKQIASRIVFPPPPAPAVIEWVASIRKLSDIDPGRGKWKKVLVGEAEKEPVLVAPTAVAIGPDETLYVVDRRAGGLAIVNVKKKRFEIFKGAGSGRLAEPVGVAVSEAGDLYVSDATARAIFVFDAVLNFRAAFAPVKFQRPTALALSADGAKLAVCDTPANKVYLLDAKDGKVLGALGKGERSGEEGAFHTPVAAAFDEQGFLYVADYLNFRIQVFDADGGVELAFGKAGNRAGDLNRPRGIAADASAKVIYEVDAAFQLVQMFNFDGELLMWFGGPGAGPAEFQLPSGMARRGHLLAVTDTLNNRIQLFRFLGPPAASASPPIPEPLLVRPPSPGQIRRVPGEAGVEPVPAPPPPPTAGAGAATPALEPQPVPPLPAGAAHELLEVAAPVRGSGPPPVTAPAPSAAKASRAREGRAGPG